MRDAKRSKIEIAQLRVRGGRSGDIIGRTIRYEARTMLGCQHPASLHKCGTWMHSSDHPSSRSRRRSDLRQRRRCRRVSWHRASDRRAPRPSPTSRSQRERRRPAGTRGGPDGNGFTRASSTRTEPTEHMTTLVVMWHDPTLHTHLKRRRAFPRWVPLPSHHPTYPDRPLAPMPHTLRRSRLSSCRPPPSPRRQQEERAPRSAGSGRYPGSRDDQALCHARWRA